MIDNYRQNYYVIRALIKNISVFLPFALLLVSVNYFVDPAQIFNRNHYEQGVAEILLKGSNVANVSNRDERFLQKHYIAGLQKKKDIIVLGSSRSLQIRSASFPGKSFFNHGVSGASLEDDMAIFEMYLEKNIEPKVIILELDPWLLNKNSGQERWKSIGDYYERFASRIGIDNKFSNPFFIWRDSGFFRIKKYLQIFSLSYFQSSVLYLQTQQAMADKDKKGKYYATDLTELNVTVVLSDGSYSYEKKYRELSVSEALIAAKDDTTRETVYSLGQFYELDGRLKLKFEKFLHYLLGRDIKVIFFLPPYHPYVYDYLANSPKYNIILEAEKYFRNKALENNITIISSYNPKDCGFGEADFYDGMHLKRGAVARLLK